MGGLTFLDKNGPCLDAEAVSLEVGETCQLPTT